MSQLIRSSSNTDHLAQRRRLSPVNKPSGVVAPLIRAMRSLASTGYAGMEPDPRVGPRGKRWHQSACRRRRHFRGVVRAPGRERSEHAHNDHRTPTGGLLSRDVCVDGRPRRPSGPESRLQVHGGDAGRTDVFASDPHRRRDRSQPRVIHQPIKRSRRPPTRSRSPQRTWA
jgi:hypothetical protein